MAEETACWMFDWRHTAADIEDVQLIIDSMKAIAKKWVFQREVSDTGYDHYQGRFSLIKKRRATELKRNWAKMNLGIPLPMYLEPSTDKSYKKDEFFYAMKAETRAEGPWKDSDKSAEVKYIPRQWRGKLETMYPWQKVVFDSAKNFNDRTVNLIYDPVGNNGKTVIAGLCSLHVNGVIVPAFNDFKEITQAFCNIVMGGDMRQPGPTLIDLPRAMNKEMLNGMYSAIEQIKSGYVYDARNKFKKWYYDSPAVWVFTNTLPDFDRLLSGDRWRLWTISTERELVVFERPENKCMMKK